MATVEKPLGIKAYGHIGHLPGSRMGPADRTCPTGQARIATGRPRDSHDRVIVQEKLDGSCCAVARIGGAIVPLQRAGFPAWSSPYDQHRLFHEWAIGNADRFKAALAEGERIVGEWLMQAHGTRYDLPHEPFVAFDLMAGSRRADYDAFRARAAMGGLTIPRLLHDNREDRRPFGIAEALRAIDDRTCHGALEPVEGAVWRVERKGVVDFLCKFVRPDKIDGKYLPDVSGGAPVWNRYPGSDAKR